MRKNRGPKRGRDRNGKAERDLLVACTQGDPGSVEAYRGDLERLIDTRMTAMCIAASHGHMKVCEALTHKGADLDAYSQNGMTPLLAAVRADSLGVVEFLLSRGANPAPRDFDNRTPMHYVRSVGMVEALGAGGKSAVTPKGRCSETPLHTCRSEEVAQALLDLGADPTAKDKEGSTPLHAAASPEVLSVLAAQKATNLNCRDDKGRTAIHRVVVKFSSLSPDWVSPFAADGANVDMRDNQGWNPIHHLYNAKNVHQHLPHVLVMNGADPNAQDVEGQTPSGLLARGRKMVVLIDLLRGSWDAGTEVDLRAADNLGRPSKHLERLFRSAF